MSIEYYNQHAQEFFDNTAELSLSELYRVFTLYLKPGSHILDIGCGSGRDAKYFSEQGYNVTAYDGSEALVTKARQLTGQNILCQTFQEVKWDNTFDGLWACASLLHVPMPELKQVFDLHWKALKPGGVFYLSFKKGIGSYTKDNRFFQCFTEETINELLANQADLHIEKIWTTTDVRPGRKTEYWLNILLKRR